LTPERGLSTSVLESVVLLAVAEPSAPRDV
jgi:hypothetical protein